MGYLYLLAVLPLVAVHPESMMAMRWERRVLLVSAPAPQDEALAAQRRIVTAWKAGAEARDLSVVEIVSESVVGATDSATALRRRYGLPAQAFGAVLIGKDGGEKLRDTHPIPAATLETTIDSMPMRRNGQR